MTALKKGDVMYDPLGNNKFWKVYYYKGTMRLSLHQVVYLVYNNNVWFRSTMYRTTNFLHYKIKDLAEVHCSFSFFCSLLSWHHYSHQLYHSRKTYLERKVKIPIKFNTIGKSISQAIILSSLWLKCRYDKYMMTVTSVTDMRKLMKAQIIFQTDMQRLLHFFKYFSTLFGGRSTMPFCALRLVWIASLCPNSMLRSLLWSMLKSVVCVEGDESAAFIDRRWWSKNYEWKLVCRWHSHYKTIKNFLKTLNR